MKTFLKILKWFGIILGALVLILAVTVSFRQNLKFDAPYPDVQASDDSSIISHGEYLVYGPSHCADCHVPVEDNPRVEKGEKVPLKGGRAFVLPVGIVYTKNITPDLETGIANLSDKDIARLLRYGVKPDGTAVLDFMAYHNMSDEDLTAVISFLRSMKPVKNKVPENSFNTLGKIVKAFLIEPMGPEGEVHKKVRPDTTAEYGKYLATDVANCRGCHTDRDMMTGAYIGQDFAGGMKIEVDNKPGTFTVSRNLTPDPETGNIYSWNEEVFLKRFRSGKIIADSPMPWGPYSNFSDDDLKAIYNFLHSLKPVHNDTGPALITEMKN